MKNLPDLRTPFRALSIGDIMECMFGLKDFETHTYLELINGGATTVNELVDQFNKDRSTVQRALQNLAIAGLIYREQRNIKNGGYYYVYHAAPFDEIRSTIKESVRKWCDSVTNWIDTLEMEK